MPGMRLQGNPPSELPTPRKSPAGPANGAAQCTLPSAAVRVAFRPRRLRARSHLHRDGKGAHARKTGASGKRHATAKGAAEPVRHFPAERSAVMAARAPLQTTSSATLGAERGADLGRLRRASGPGAGRASGGRPHGCAACGAGEGHEVHGQAARGSRPWPNVSRTRLAPCGAGALVGLPHYVKTTHRTDAQALEHRSVAPSGFPAGSRSEPDSEG